MSDASSTQPSGKHYVGFYRMTMREEIVDSRIANRVISSLFRVRITNDKFMIELNVILTFADSVLM